MSSNIDKIAWLHMVDGRVLCARSKGKDTYYIPGGKREPGETDIDTLIREVEEELSVRIKPETAVYFGTFETQAHGKSEGIRISMACYFAEYEGELRPASEIDELAWFAYGDKERVSPVSQIIFDRLYEENRLS